MNNISDTLSWFTHAETRLAAVTRYHPDNTSEINRLTAAVADIKTRLTDSDIEEFKARKARVKTRAEINAENEALMRKLSENKDRTSI